MALFSVGQVVATRRALAVCTQNLILPTQLVDKHANGNWGELDAEDIQANVDAIAYGGRILSKYTVGDGKIWVITEADRSSTCVLLPSDY